MTDLSSEETLPGNVAGEVVDGESPTLGAPRGGASFAPRPEVGAQVGRYVLLAELGRGGMGVVYAAYDPELDRKIAVKLLRPGTAGPGDTEGRTRLLREAQAMAKVSHPNVVAVHDVGTIGDEVFVAMEFIEGENFGSWLKREPRDWRAVLAALIQIGQGVRAVHEEGLIHRDLKPANAMVSDRGRFQVMDFGLARVGGEHTSPNVASASVSGPLGLSITQTGAIIGSPAYLSPEQLEGKTVDVRSDIFSFCVMAWEAFYGERPYRGQTLVELATSVLRGKISSPPKDRRVPAWVRPALSKGLETQPADRYESMRAVLAALGRGQRAARRRQLITGVGIAVAMVPVGVQQWLQADIRAENACEEAAQAVSEIWPGTSGEQRAAIEDALFGTGSPAAAETAAGVSKWLDRYAEEWRAASERVCVARDVDDSRNEELSARAVACLDERRQQLQALVGVLSDSGSVSVADAVPAAAGLPPLQACESDRWLEAQPWLADAETDIELQQRLARLDALGATGSSDVVAELESLLDDVQGDRTRATVLRQLASAYKSASDQERAEEALKEAFVLAGKANDDATAAEAATDLVLLIGYSRAKQDEGLYWGQLADMMIQRLGTAAPPMLAASLDSTVGVIHGEKGNYDEAVERYERALDVQKREFGERHPQVATTLSNLGAARKAQGRFEEAVELHRLSLEIRKESLGPNHPAVATSLSNMGKALFELGRYEEAGQAFERSLEIQENVLGSKNTGTAIAASLLGDVRQEEGKLVEAQELKQRALDTYVAVLGPDHPNVASGYNGLGRLALAGGDVERAIEAHVNATEIYGKALGQVHPYRGLSLLALARAELADEQSASALQHAQEALAIGEKVDAYPEIEARAHFLIARARWNGGDENEETVALARDALREHEALAGDQREAITEIQAWLNSR